MTDTAVDRLRRRLGITASDDSDEASADTAPLPALAADEDGDDPRSLLPQWLPDANPRRDGWWATARADPGRAGMIALGSVAALAVLVTVFTLLREDSAPVSSAKLPPVTTADADHGSIRPQPSTTAADDGPVIVSVVGLVDKPGLVTLTPGARVADALEAAGGTVAKADTTGLNMARKLADGEQVLVGIAAAPGAPAALGSSVTGGLSAAPAQPGSSGTAAKPADSDPGVPVNLNTAGPDELDKLPGIGPVTASAIIAWREANGAFTSVDQLAEVDGIGTARLARVRDLVRV